VTMGHRNFIFFGMTATSFHQNSEVFYLGEGVRSGDKGPKISR